MNHSKRKPLSGPARLVVHILVTLLVGALYFYFKLPALNFHDTGIYTMLFLMAAVFCLLSLFGSGVSKSQSVRELAGIIRKSCAVPFLICVALVLLLLIGALIGAPIFRADSYNSLLAVESGDFVAEVEEISYDQIPMLDLDSATRLGNRKLGELADMVSQFEVAADYTQINYQGRPVRVTPLEYGDLIKWFNNRAEGLPAYLIIDMVTQNVEVVRLEEGIKYTTNEHFGRYLYRHLRFNYPTYMFDDATFEIDEQGNPYWVCPRIIKRIGLFGGTDIKGAVLVDAVTGECTYYEDVPNWVDRVYTPELIIEQYDYYGTYINGFWNSLFGQRGVTRTTDGYNYIAIHDDVYMYTGITSAGSDESNVGFILTNERTKETKFYPVAGAEEYSAMASAEGVVQNLRYVATFPLLLNISEQPTYFMALKDSAELVKMYAMVNVEQYQIVATGATVAACELNYRQMLANNDITEEIVVETTGVTGVIADIRSAVLEGNTRYYVRLEDQDCYYIIELAGNELAAVLNPGDRVTIDAADTAGELRSAHSISRAS